MTTDGSRSADFESFIANWRRSRLSGLSKADLESVAEEHARELTQAALKAGFRFALTKASDPYRSIVDYVKALHDIEDTQHLEE